MADGKVLRAARFRPGRSSCALPVLRCFQLGRPGPAARPDSTAARPPRAARHLRRRQRAISRDLPELRRHRGRPLPVSDSRASAHTQQAQVLARSCTPSSPSSATSTHTISVCLLCMVWALIFFCFKRVRPSLCTTTFRSSTGYSFGHLHERSVDRFPHPAKSHPLFPSFSELTGGPQSSALASATSDSSRPSQRPAPLVSLCG
jgi:hypothetical protein